MAKLFLAVLLLAVPSLGQQAATCDDSLGFKDWAYNSKNQSPCEIASALAAPCYGGSFNIAAIQPGQFYGGPTKATESKCRCNTVFFDVLSACAACQGADLTTWSQFKFNCSTIYPGLYPDTLPVPVPAYAYQDVTTTDKFDVNAAQALEKTGAQESSASTNQATSSSVPSPSISVAPPAVSTASSNSGKSTNVGAIAGGTVGGVIGAAIIGLGLWAFLRRRRRRQLAKREAILGEPKSYYATDPNSPPYAGFGLPTSPSARSTDADATFNTSITPYPHGDQSMDTHGHYYGGGHSLERRPSSPEI